MRLSAVVLTMFVLGCGGSSSHPTNGGSIDMTPQGNGGGGAGGGAPAGGGGGGTATVIDMASGAAADLAGASTGSFECGTLSCPTGVSCCVVGTTPSCTNQCSGFTASCGKPGDCSNGTTCCITAQASLLPSLTVTIQNIACMPFDSCVPGVDATSLKVLSRACNTDADCTSDGKGGSDGTQYPNCCTNTGQRACFKNQAPLPAGWTCP